LASRRLCAGLVIGFVLLALAPSLTMAADAVVRDTTRWPSASYVGLRLGAWIDQGGELNDPNVTASFTKTGFFTELFYDHSLMPWLFLEISMGIASRGDAVFTAGSDRYIGTINLYPMLAQVKFTPLGTSRSWQPYLLGGGGLTVGKQNTDIVQSYGSYLDPYYVEESETAFGYVYGAGVDVALSHQLGLTISSKYHSIHFSGDLAGISNYSGTSIAVGLIYFIHPSKQHSQPWRRP
jgi:opacity protein-like surface antigen